MTATASGVATIIPRTPNKAPTRVTAAIVKTGGKTWFFLTTDYAFSQFDFVRLQAGVLEWNPRSRRVLEKAGYHLEARLAKAIYKDGQTIDSWLYVRLRA